MVRVCVEDSEMPMSSGMAKTELRDVVGCTLPCVVLHRSFLFVSTYDIKHRRQHLASFDDESKKSIDRMLTSDLGFVDESSLSHFLCTESCTER